MALKPLVNIISYSEMSQNRGLVGVWGNDGGENWWEGHRNGVLCANWGVIAAGVAQRPDE